jgi:hypothetical protein
LSIWSAAVDARGTLSADYLRTRGIFNIDGCAGHALRHHARCSFGGVHSPCLIALVRSIVDDKPQAIHRTALAPNGRKALVGGKDRMALGPISGGAIKLTADESVTGCLGIAEGIETALSLQLVPEFGTSPVWALISAAGLAAFPLLPGIESLWVAVDHDAAGVHAAETVGTRWRHAGREVLFVTPKAASTIS